MGHDAPPLARKVQRDPTLQGYTAPGTVSPSCAAIHPTCCRTGPCPLRTGLLAGVDVRRPPGHGMRYLVCRNRSAVGTLGPNLLSARTWMV